jgi:hypothetical protein
VSADHPQGVDESSLEDVRLTGLDRLPRE